MLLPNPYPKSKHEDTEEVTLKGRKKFTLSKLELEGVSAITA